jgi:hypothetical protein
VFTTADGGEIETIVCVVGGLIVTVKLAVAVPANAAEFKLQTIRNAAHLITSRSIQKT